MKAIAQSLLLAALLGLVAPLAYSADSGRYSSERLEVCNDYADVGRTVMQNRQEGKSMQVQMMAAQKMDPGLRDSIGSIIEMAYEEPRYTTPQAQQLAIDEFTNERYAECVKVRRSK